MRFCVLFMPFRVRGRTEKVSWQNFSIQHTKQSIKLSCLRQSSPRGLGRLNYLDESTSECAMRPEYHRPYFCDSAFIAAASGLEGTSDEWPLCCQRFVWYISGGFCLFVRFAWTAVARKNARESATQMTPISSTFHQKSRKIRTTSAPETILQTNRPQERKNDRIVESRN